MTTFSTTTQQIVDLLHEALETTKALQTLSTEDWNYEKIEGKQQVQANILQQISALEERAYIEQKEYSAEFMKEKQKLLIQIQESNNSFSSHVQTLYNLTYDEIATIRQVQHKLAMIKKGYATNESLFLHKTHIDCYSN